jgi:hypothetical protein
MPIPGHESARNGALNEIHDRWIDRRLRKELIPELQDEWSDTQCGMCAFWFPLAGELGRDWGVCTNAGAPYDQRAMFEHDGCDHFREAGSWVVPEEM